MVYQSNSPKEDRKFSYRKVGGKMKFILSKFKQEKYRLIERICRCDNYEELVGVVKYYLASKECDTLSEPKEKE